MTTTAQLIAQSRFQQTMRVLHEDQSGRSPYGLKAESGYLGKRDPETGLKTFTDPSGVATPARDLRSGAAPSDHDATAIDVAGGTTYVR